MFFIQRNRFAKVQFFLHIVACKMCSGGRGKGLVKRTWFF